MHGFGFWDQVIQEEVELSRPGLGLELGTETSCM